MPANQYLGRSVREYLEIARWLALHVLPALCVPTLQVYLDNSTAFHPTRRDYSVAKS